MSKILVTGATGTNGQALISKLTGKHADFVAAARNPEIAKPKLPAQTEIRAFSFEDPSTFETATQGVDRVFLLGPPLQYDVDRLIIPFLDFLKAKNILKVVYFSALSSEKMGETLSFHKIIEEKLKNEGFDYTILQPTFFSQNFKTYESENIRERNMLFLPAGNGKVGFVDVEDIAAVAATALTENGHGRKTYQLTGPELLDYNQAAGLLSDVLGKPVTYANPTPELFTQVVTGSGAPAFIADYLISVYGVIARNETAVLTDDVQQVTGKKPASLEEVLVRDFRI